MEYWTNIELGEFFPLYQIFNSSGSECTGQRGGNNYFWGWFTWTIFWDTQYEASQVEVIY